MKKIKIAEHVNELPFNSEGLCEITIDGKKICLIQHKNSIHACAAKCPHAGVRLSEGYLDALGNIVCPIHRYKFSITDGRNSSGEGYFLKTFRIEDEGDGVYVEL